MNDKAIKAAVIGHPIGHSKSPLIHNYWIEKYGLSGSYEAVDIACENLKAGVENLRDKGFAGFNATIPHKEALLDLCDTLDDTARACGAVNTVVFKDGKIRGYNTDAFGFITNIRAAAPDFDFAKGPATVIGAGGAARAVLFGLIEAGVPKIRLANRTRAKAEALVQSLDPQQKVIETLDWDQRHAALDGANFVVNTSSLGMDKQPALELSLDDLPPAALVTDIVYSPLETDLLKNAKARGNQTVTGIGMLLHQARPAFEKWFGVLPDVDETLQERVLK